MSKQKSETGGPAREPVRRVRLILLRVARLLFRMATHDNRIPPPHQISAPPDGQAEAIVVTTHAKRFEQFAEPLMRALSVEQNRPIYLIINGDFPEGGFDGEVRSRFLRSISDLQHVNPICIGTGRGMAFLWNTGIRLSSADRILVLSDDLDVDSQNVASMVRQCFEALKSADLVVVNRSFGIFALRRDLLFTIGWFDELLLGFGCEDLDFFWRCEAHTDVDVMWTEAAGLRNTFSKIGYETFVKGTGKYSLFNRAATFGVLFEADDAGHQGMFNQRYRRRLPVVDYYPGETMFREWQGLIAESNESVILQHIAQDLPRVLRGMSEDGANGLHS